MGLRCHFGHWRSTGLLQAWNRGYLGGDCHWSHNTAPDLPRVFGDPLRPFTERALPAGLGWYVWKRLLTISAEDCWGVITHKVKSLCGCVVVNEIVPVSFSIATEPKL